jgi:phage/plasmid-like protein (TIGR03299 family)
MSHGIYIDENNKASFAHTGSREAIWHRLGSELPEGASIEVWKTAAGMDWNVKESDVIYWNESDAALEKSNFLATKSRFPKRKILYRSDTGSPLSIVGENYNVVQPQEALEFFRDLTESHGMKLSTAGCLFNGARYWALAETGRTGEILNGDIIKGHLLFITSVDGTLSTTARFVSTRVVCNNTLTVAMNEDCTNLIRKTHRSNWDSQQAKIEMGLLDKNWESFLDDLRRLSECRMTDVEVNTFFEKTLFDPKRDLAKQRPAEIRKVNRVMDLYYNGAGAAQATKTAYGALNAATNLLTHGTPRTSPDKNFWNGYIGNDAEKNRIMSSLLELC